MNANAEIEQALQQLGKLLKTRQSCKDSVLEQLKTDVTPRSIHSASSPRFRRGLIGALAVGGCALLVFGYFVLNASVTSKAFAQVREAVQNIRSAVITYENKSQPELNMKVYLLKSGEFRQEFAGGLVRIFSPQEKRYIGMEAESKTAWFSPESVASDAWFPIQRILNVDKSAVRKLGTRERGGLTLTGFLLSRESDQVRVELWTDPDTHLPVELIESPTSPDDPLVSHRNSVMKFQFNKEIAASLFSITPPETFRLVEDGPLHPLPTFPRGIDMQKFQLKPGIGIGELTLGDDLTDVITSFGIPSELTYTTDGKFFSREKPEGAIDYYLVAYNALGLKLKFREDIGLFSITAEDGMHGVRTFPGKTTENIGIGATLNDVTEAYGKPSRARGPSDSPFALIYGDKGLSFVMVEGRVTAIFINEIN